MRLRALLLACAATAALFGLAACVADGGYGYGYDYDYYGPDVDFDGGFWGPDYYVGPGHFHGSYGPRGGHPYRPAPGGHLPPSLPHGAPHVGGAPRAGGGAFHGGSGGPRSH